MTIIQLPQMIQFLEPRILQPTLQNLHLPRKFKQYTMLLV